MHYVYIIQSINYPDQIYVGHTSDLKKRLSNHNCGTTPHTDKYKPWELILCMGFKNRMKAIEFEIYLKSGSGREFRNRRLI
jgi:predicted GIY-YIG superfamily endonuclease